MELKRYLHLRNMTTAAFARKINIPRPTLSAIVNKIRTPSNRIAKLIAQGTNDMVTVAELRTGEYDNTKTFIDLKDQKSNSELFEIKL